MMINYRIEKLLEKKAKEFRYPGMHATWFLKNDYIYIVTTHPGYWIGKAGKNVFELNEEIAKICEEERLPKLTIRFIESGHSMPDEKTEKREDKFFTKKYVYTGNISYLIYDGDNKPYEVIISEYAYEGAEDILESFGYRNRGWVDDEKD